MSDPNVFYRIYAVIRRHMVVDYRHSVSALRVIFIKKSKRLTPASLKQKKNSPFGELSFILIRVYGG